VKYPGTFVVVNPLLPAAIAVGLGIHVATL
jgi:hypothetical protein